MEHPAENIILGIDPGTNLMGYGIIRASGKKTSYIDMGVVDLKKEGGHHMKGRSIPVPWN